MAPSLKPTGENGAATPEDLIHSIITQLLVFEPSESLQSARRLLPVLARLGSPQALPLLQRLLQSATPSETAVLWASWAEGIAERREEASAALDQARALTASTPDPRAWSALARAEAALGHDPGASLDRVRLADTGPAADILDDLLSLNDLSGALKLIARIPTDDGDVSRYAILCAALHAAGRLPEILPIIQQHGDILVQSTILRAALAAPEQARDLDAVFAIIEACPAAYQNDLLEPVILRWIDDGRLGVAQRALRRWGEQSPDSVIRLGMLSMLGDEDAMAALKAVLEERLEVEEVAWHDTWRYQDLGRACGWAGNLGGTLSALERVVDHEDRMAALLSAIRHAPRLAREPLLCAARGLAASMQDDRHRAESVGHLGAVQVALGQRRSGLALLDEASRLAIGVRRPRSDQGFARRAALESVITDQLRADDLVGAFRTARKLRTRHMRNPHLSVIAARCAVLGDLGGVRCCLENMHPDLSLVDTGTHALQLWLDAGQPVSVTEAA